MQVTLKGLPGVIFSAQIPGADRTAIKYTNMRVGSDSVLPVDPFDVEVEPIEGEAPAVTAYHLVLRQVVAATLDAFLEAQELVIEKAQQQLTL